MILVITPEMRGQYQHLIQDYFRIRKTVFHDTLGWDVAVDGDLEYDRYDFMPCTYVLSLDDRGDVTGGLRQMSMAGPNLTWECFSDMIPDPAELLSPKITETTRFAIRPQERDVRVMSGVNRTAIELSNASLELGFHAGITRHVAICEENIVRLTKSFGIKYHIIGRREMENSAPILCVSWEVSEASLEKLAWIKEKVAAA
ncbi:acyl-homoserine-lactone synthase [Sinorhizobium sp. BG8]|uniref:acyl-homoserine-lactone synthase n=1 Tax=Sinorhizobium sp. BG8 TaxID=2613773 RepID=UPI00193DC26B|nr:acyl-homoserine-lactone synthase [Sinorhizobium sp. BG8]